MLTHWLRVLKTSVDYWDSTLSDQYKQRVLTTGTAQFWTTVIGCTTWFDWVWHGLTHVWDRPFGKLKGGIDKVRTHVDRMQVKLFETSASLAWGWGSIRFYKNCNRVSFLVLFTWINKRNKQRYYSWGSKLTCYKLLVKIIF